MAIYLKHFSLPGPAAEAAFFASLKMTCFNTYYPYGTFQRELPVFHFAPVTILCGGNGSGKTTILNVIAEKLELGRVSPFNRSSFFEDYVAGCGAVMAEDEFGNELRVPPNSRFIASDDVFGHIFKLRAQNEEIDRQRLREFETYRQASRPMQLQSLDQYEEFSTHVEARRRTMSSFVRRRVEENRRERSNGESAFVYFTETIGENSLYLLDEPENSLSPALQLELIDFLAASVRTGDQFIIATHSPLILSMPEAVVYDLDTHPVRPRPWHELESSRVYYDFFRSQSPFFEKK